jgi:endonuclease/exonuclease/phosphatase family metal-dependent hydrolase
MKFALLLLLLTFQGWAKWSVSTYNIRNFDRDPGAGQTDSIELAKIIKEMKSDVMVFQEVVNREAFETLIQGALPDHKYVLSSCGGFGRQLLAVVYDAKTFEFIQQTEDLSFSGSTSGKCGSLRPVFLVELLEKATKKKFTFGAVHLKAGSTLRAMEQRWQQYLKLESLAQQHQAKNLILLGDFNTTGFIHHDQDFEKFDSLLDASSLVSMSQDIGCTNYWEGTQGGEAHQPSILDHIVLQDKAAKSVESIKLGAHCVKHSCLPKAPEELGRSYQSVSDHCPVKVTFR